MTKNELQAAEIIALRLEAMSDPYNDACGIAADVKEAVRLYIRSSVLPIAEALAKPAAKRENGEAQRLIQKAVILAGLRVHRREAREKRRKHYGDV